MLRCVRGIIVVMLIYSPALRADELLYRYEGEVLPYDMKAGWDVYDPCAGVCTESVEQGCFVLRWLQAGDAYYFNRWIARSGEPAPPSLSVEWRFRSNHPIPEHTFSCDGRFFVRHRNISEVAYFYGDAIVSESGAQFLVGLELGQSLTYRFESPNGNEFRLSVDGTVAVGGTDNNPGELAYLQFGGSGGCVGFDEIPNKVHRWDFIRFGTIAYGEQVVAADPHDGFLDARKHAGIDRFLVRFDEPNYVHIDKIMVEVVESASVSANAGVLVPVVVKTWRREPPDPFDVEDDPRIVEIVLDRPIPFSATTRFTIDDGVAVNLVEYTFAPGDVNGTGTIDLSDIAYLQNCVGSTDTASLCGVFDFDRDGSVSLQNAASVVTSLQDPAS